MVALCVFSSSSIGQNNSVASVESQYSAGVDVDKGGDSSFSLTTIDSCICFYTITFCLLFPKLEQLLLSIRFSYNLLLGSF